MTRGPRVLGTAAPAVAAGERPRVTNGATAYVTREQGVDVTCPHCRALMARVARCCVCRGEGLVSAKRAAAALRNVWARKGCDCQACGILRLMEAEMFG